MLKVIGLLVIVAATIAAMVECAQTRSPRLLPRWTWLVVILLVPVIGPALWFLAGRSNASSATSRPIGAPDDDPRFIRELGDQAWLRKQRERRNRNQPPDPGPNPA